MPKPEKERRKQTRFKMALDVTCEFTGERDLKPGKSGDISKGGVRVYSQHKAQIGDHLKITIDLGSERKVLAEAKVIWVMPAQDLSLDVEYSYVLGLQFLDVSKDDSSLLGKFIEDSLVRGE